jgi:hypothetical protein
VSDFPEDRARVIYLDLVRSLEKARSRLAVAIATESKATPLDRLRYYREMEETMHRWLRDLRGRRRAGLEAEEEWLKVLESLKRVFPGPDHLPARPGAALQLCERLREALAPLEQLWRQESRGEESRAVLQSGGAQYPKKK